MVAVFADESCLGNGREGDNPGGAAGLIEYRGPGADRLTRWDYWRSEPRTTNNRMALWSVIEAFRIIGRKGHRFRVVFTSDSTYVVKGMGEWVHGWMARGWRRKAGAVENLELWQEAVECARPHLTQWVWVRGHHGHVQNEYVNDLAIRAAGVQTTSHGAVASGFDEWLATKRAAGRMPAEPSVFPPARTFKPSRPYAVADATLLP
jgi:ribonuclease HI